MPHIPRANCQHLDNYRRCRVHPAPWWLRWLLPATRPACVLDGPAPRDGARTCIDQVPRRRPAPPATWRGHPRRTQ